jgi:hypothetical protein
MKRSALTLDDVRLVSEDAWRERRLWDGVLDEVHSYVLPFRRSASLGAPGRNELYDSTAIHSALRCAGRIQQDLFPPGMNFYELLSGPLVTDERDKQQLNAMLQGVGAIAGAVFRDPTWDTSVSEACLDILGGTSAQLVLDGDDRRMAGFKTVPIQEIALAEGPWGEVEFVSWKRKWQARHLPRLFRGGSFPASVVTMIEKSPSQAIEIMQDTIYDPSIDRWLFVAYLAQEKHEISRRLYRKKRWITPRFFKLPGETMGRGPAMLALPNAKTLNRTMELVLKSAALGLFGVYLYQDDNVFDPTRAVMKPGALWKVSRTGGMNGAPITPLEVGRNFDISNIVLSDQREQVRVALFDEPLPDLKDSVRSPSEIMERLRRNYRDFAGATGRLTIEWVKPAVEAVIDVLEEKGALPTRLNIDQMMAQITVTSRLGRAQALDDVQKLVEGAQIAATLGGDQAMQLYAKIETILPDVLRKLGWNESYIRPLDERQAAQARDQQMQQAQMAIDMMSKLPQPGPAAPPLRLAA